MVYHRDSDRKKYSGFHSHHKPRPRYAIIDERPFMPFRLLDGPRKIASSHPYPGYVIKTLKKFDFVNNSYKSVSDLTRLFLQYREKDHPSISVGKYGIVNYDFAPEALYPESLNPENAAVPRDTSSRDVLKNLTFVNAKDKHIGIFGAPRPRLALALGRLTAQHHNPDRVSQSHWVLFLDQTRLLWACYAYGIDNDDIQLDEKGSPGPYSSASDSAFGADRPKGQKVVFLGSIDEIPFKWGKEMKNVKVYDLKWTTSPLSAEQNWL